jgi:methylthioribose-1-phosphate isomerase
VADCIRTLAVRGAPAIGIAAAYGLALAGDDRTDAAELLRSTRPTAVNLGWALDQVLAADDPLARARELHAAQDEADRRMAALGAELFTPGDRALTHCNAGALATAGYGTAGGVLRSAWEAGRLEHVWVDETRPLLQGARLTTYELARAGIPHRLISDSSAGAVMARGLVDRIVVGADRIAANGDVANKVGTYSLAVLAARHDIPFYVAAPVSTIDPGTATGAEIPIEERDAAELADGVPALNLAFDVTPAELLGAIVTEAGVLEAPYEEAIRSVTGR